jgi:hypothetical protein
VCVWMCVCARVYTCVCGCVCVDVCVCVCVCDTQQPSTSITAYRQHTWEAASTCTSSTDRHIRVKETYFSTKSHSRLSQELLLTSSILNQHGLNYTQQPSTSITAYVQATHLGGCQHMYLQHRQTHRCEGNVLFTKSHCRLSQELLLTSSILNQHGLNYT